MNPQVNKEIVVARVKHFDAYNFLKTDEEQPCSLLVLSGCVPSGSLYRVCEGNAIK